MYEGPTSTKFGQVAIAEPLRFDLLEFHDDTPLKEVEHDIPIPVLDQEDLDKQGIDVTKLVPGAAAADALGSCTCNTGTAHIAERWAAAGKDITGLKLTGGTGAIAMSGTDGTADEEFAILLYHLVTDQTGVPCPGMAAHRLRLQRPVRLPGAHRPGLRGQLQVRAERHRRPRPAAIGHRHAGRPVVQLVDEARQ